MDILVSRTLYLSCQAGPGIEPGPSVLKASDLPFELTWQTIIDNYPNGDFHPNFKFNLIDENIV